jgi:hypothetical protein
MFLAIFMAAFVFCPLAAGAQVTNGSISGRIADQSGGSLPGVVITATHVETGVPREAVTDEGGAFRLAGLPVGTYRLEAKLGDFQAAGDEVAVGLGENKPVNLVMRLALKQDVTVTALPPRVSSIQENVDFPRLETLPLNGRQFADAVATLPGVGLGSHSDGSKSSQHTAQVNGGNGRNMNTIVDGGDNNDDTVGGIAQQIPLEAIQQLSLLSVRFDAEYGRAGAVMNIVTKSGTNTPRGSWFNLFRDDTLNARTTSERNADVEKQGYERYQYGGSFGGPIVVNRTHFFGALERTHQDTAQVIDTGGLFEGDGVRDMRMRQDLFSGKVTTVLTPSQYLAVRYAYEGNSQPSGAGRTIAATAWATSTNKYHSVNANHSWALRRSALNELVFQFSDYKNDTPASAAGPAITLANGTHKGGANPNAPQATEQRRWQVRNDYSWTMSRFGGLGHEFRTGASVVHTPRLFVLNQGGTLGMLTMRTNDVNGGVASLLKIGGTASSNIPLTWYGFYVQDDWRVTDRLTLNLGLRWDYLDGIQIEQTSTNFLNMQAAGETGRFEGTLLEDFGKTPRGDRDNIQPRLGAVYDLFGNGRSLVRGGFGVHTDMAYTNANVLTSSLEGGGIVASVSCLSSSAPTPYCDPTRGFIHADGSGTLFHYTDPLSVLGIPDSIPTTGEVVSPRLEQPFTYQSNLGFSQELNRLTSISVDYVHVEGRDLNMRVRPNVDTDPGPGVVRYLNGIAVTPFSNAFRTVISKGRSRYRALILSGRRRMADGFDLNASYTLAKATSDVGTAYDELTQNLLQDINDPFSDFQNGPSTRTDARHRVTASAIVRAPYAISVAAILSYRSALPVTTLAGTDLNADGQNNDHTTVAYRYTGLDGTVATFEEAGTCETVNCSRRAPFSQLNLRISRAFPLFREARIEAIAEVFNVFNAKNPFISTSSTFTGSTFMQPIAYAGDLGQGEQRVAQFGFRITF